jgi:predicted nucleotidyltransferase
MKILGIISEYNPFHMGHAFQLQKAQAKVGSCGVMTLMSGSITQRGEFAIFNKWVRTQLALQSGIDLVCELPTVYACQSAEMFGRGGVEILNATGVCDILSFGSESGILSPLEEVAKLLVNESLEFKMILFKYLDTGVSFPKARELTVSELLGEELSRILKSPNNILAIEYLKALIEMKSTISPLTISRQGAGYHSMNDSEFLSATRIRQILIKSITEKKGLDNNLNALKNKLPYPVEKLIQPLNNYCLYGDERYLDTLRYAILEKDIDDLRNYPYISEGLEHKIRDALKIAKNMEELVNLITSKRIPKTRVKRLLVNRLLGIQSQDLEVVKQLSSAPYLRVLGFNLKGQEILKKIKKQGNIPIITNLKSNAKKLTVEQLKIINYDVRGTDLHNLFYEKSYHYHRDYTQGPIRYK